MSPTPTHAIEPPDPPDIDAAIIDYAGLAEFVALCGQAAWRQRMAAILRPASGARSARGLQQRHVVELTLAGLMHRRPNLPSVAEQRLAELAVSIAQLAGSLTATGRAQLCQRLRHALADGNSLIPLFHLARTACLQRERGFTVQHAGWDEAAPFDLLLRRNGAEVEVSCETVSAEDGRDLHRSAWFNLVDGIDPDLQTWLSAHPGRYLLKMTLPQGLREPTADAGDGANAADGGLARLAELQRRIRDMLSRRLRSDHDEAAVLRLDPLLLAGAQAGELGLMSSLRDQFGPEAQLAVTRSGTGMFVMAARAGRQDDIGAAVHRRMQQAAPRRFSGSRPGILALFLDDIDRRDWRALRDGLQFEAEMRQFLTTGDASRLVAVTAASRAELCGASGPDAARDGDLRFRNQLHRAAGNPDLASAVMSSF